MKIAFLNLYGGINNRGAETFSDELALNLGKKHEIKFFRGADLRVSIVQPTHSASLLKYMFLDKASLSVLNFTLKIFKELWSGKFDLIVPMNGFWQVLLCKLIFKSKILITGHSGPGWDEKWNLWLKPNVFVATTEPTKVWAKSVCPWTKVVTIPYGIDLAKFTNGLPVKLNLEKPIILCPAAAVPYKRIDLAIEAVARLKKGSLLHLGTGPLISEIRKHGQSKLGNRFLSLTVPAGEMPKYYKACDVVTLPSEPQENSPMVFLEAMAAGKTTVTTDSNRARWILAEAGIFINPGKLEDYALALEKRVDQKIIANQVKNYSWEKIIAQYEDLLTQI